MNKKIVVVGLMALFLGLTVPSVFACGRPEMGGKKGEGKLESMFFYKAHAILKAQDKLELSDEQAQAIRDLKTETKKNLIRQKAEIEVLDLDIQSQLHADKPNFETLQKLIDQKYEVKKTKEKATTEAFVKLKTSLSDKQWAAFKELKKEWKPEGFEHHSEERGEHERN